MKTLLHVVGARPNFMKAAPVMEALAKQGSSRQLLVHTGQHYDRRMSELFFEQLNLPQPDWYLGVGSGTHAEQTGRIMIEFEKVLNHARPDWVVVMGDVNSTIACALTAAKQHVAVAHIEAGLRSFNRRMAEEINRVLTDHLSELLFTTEPAANENLQREGIPEDRIHFVGNVMADALLGNLAKAEAQANVLAEYGVEAGEYGVVTLHRPETVDNPPKLKAVVEALQAVQEHLSLVFPVHPRTRDRLTDLELDSVLEQMPNLTMTPPLGYLDFLLLMAKARLVMTDSGGIQVETTVLGVPCLTVREETEVPVTVAEGTNVLVGRDPDRIVAAAQAILSGHTKSGRRPELWDGHAAERIAAVFAGI